MTSVINWIDVQIDYFDSPPDFLTHLHYVQFIQQTSKGLSLSFNQKLKKRLCRVNKNFDKKITLIRLTLENIKQEYETILKEPEFAQVCVSWISVKSYYLLFNLLMILRYLITMDDNSFICGHKQLLREFIGYLERNEIVFSEEKLNRVYSGSKLLVLKIKPGANIKGLNFDPEERCMQLLKKLLSYKEEDYKREEKIKTLRKKNDRNKINNFRQKTKVNLFAFFYWYRIKANYRDLEFLNKEIKAYEFNLFYSEYFKLTTNFYNAFRNLINEIALIRIVKNVLPSNNKNAKTKNKVECKYCKHKIIGEPGEVCPKCETIHIV